MKAKELDTMVKAMRSKYNKVYSRSEIQDTIYYLYKGIKAIGKDELAKELLELYMEIDSVNTNELVEIGTFR